MSEPRRATPCRPMEGLGHLLLASPDCTIAALNLPLQAQQVLICFPPAPMQHCLTVNLGSAVEPVGTSLARSTSSAPLFTLFALPTSRLYLAPNSAPHNCIQPYLGTVEPRHLTASRRYSPGKHWSLPPSPCDSCQLLPQPRPEHAVSLGSCLVATVKILSANESKCLRDLHG